MIKGAIDYIYSSLRSVFCALKENREWCIAKFNEMDNDCMK